MMTTECDCIEDGCDCGERCHCDGDCGCEECGDVIEVIMCGCGGNCACGESDLEG